MKIKLAQHCGFCFGIKRAVHIAFNEKNKSDTYILGELLHNPQFIKKLESYKIKQINSVDDISKGTVIIRAHGESTNIIKKARQKGLKIIDATCPKVKKVHILAKKLQDNNYKVVVFGDKKHPEIIGIASNIKHPIIINSTKEAQLIKHHKKIGLLSQTTNELAKYNNIKKILKSKTNDFQSYNTICDATQKRQEEANNLSHAVDIMIIVGGKHSSNTQKLAKICKKFAATYHIETAKEIQKRWFKNKKICGITAGASTPKWLIDDVVNEITNY